MCVCVCVYERTDTGGEEPTMIITKGVHLHVLSHTLCHCYCFNSKDQKLIKQLYPYLLVPYISEIVTRCDFLFLVSSIIDMLKLWKNTVKTALGSVYDDSASVVKMHATISYTGKGDAGRFLYMEYMMR